MRLGLEFNQTLRFGFALNYLNPAIHQQGGTEQNPLFHLIDFSYINIFGEYIILNNQRWEFSFPLILDGGATTVSSRSNEQDAFVSNRTVRLTVTQISAVGYYKIWKWLGLGVSIGYRNVTYKDQNDPQLSEIVTTVFDGPPWAIKTKIYVGALWRALLKKKASKKHKNIDRGTIDSQ